MKIVKTFIFAALMVFTMTATAQETIKEGYIKMEITDIKSDDAAMQAQLSMMKNTTQEVYFDNSGRSISKTDMMGGMVTTTTVTNMKDQTGYMLFNMDMMGQKIKVDLSEEIKKGMTNDSLVNLEVEHFYDDKKVILGFECHRAVISIPNTDGVTITAYVTKDIKTDAEVIQGIDAEKIGGMPLMYKMENSGIELVYEAVDFKREIDNSVFDVDTSGYDEMTMEEFQKKMGAMGGMGF